ncbi:unnamed protein product [Rangifer tarandus platyrhynchus]|uniref:Uncharacterized protein n=1 Tax=Rangifer tarandus platyrhynchus TaxID=3082113 RepID=A0AC60A9Z9_RANTA
MALRTQDHEPGRRGIATEPEHTDARTCTLPRASISDDVGIHVRFYVGHHPYSNLHLHAYLHSCICQEAPFPTVAWAALQPEGLAVRHGPVGQPCLRQPQPWTRSWDSREQDRKGSSRHGADR